MATNHAKAPRLSIIKGTMIILLALMILGWLILFGVSLLMWVSHDFESAYQWLQHLSQKQLAYLNATSTNSILNDAAHLQRIVGAINQIMLNKLIMLLSAIPLFFLSVMAGLIDGLNQRAIRAACLGRESTYVFHKSVPLARNILCLVLGLWLCVPMILPASPLFIGLAVMLGLVTRISASRFKKYL